MVVVPFRSNDIRLVNLWGNVNKAFPFLWSNVNVIEPDVVT